MLLATVKGDKGNFKVFLVSCFSLFQDLPVIVDLRNTMPSFFLFFWQYWGLNMGLTRQVLYHLSHSTSPILCWMFLR
jgi:hypothetical protein